MADTLVHKLQLNSRGVISLIGAGGKTSLMFRLAKALSGFKKKVLTTTTTNIFMPDKDQSPYALIADSFYELQKKILSCQSQYYHFSAGKKHGSHKKKLKGFKPDIINQLSRENIFDWIIVESDGAAQKPIKSSDSYEPVIPQTCTHLIHVTGLDVVGKPLDKRHVHRPEIFSRNTGLGSGKIIDETTIAANIEFEIKKATTLSRPVCSFVFLNKADIQETVISGRKIAQMLQTKTFIDKIITASLLDESPVKECLNTHEKE